MLPAMPDPGSANARVTGGHGPLAHLLESSGLYPVFQPIVQLDNGVVYAHEALIRGPEGSALHRPDALLRAAADEGLGYEFETACLQAALRAWSQTPTPGRLFLNVSAHVLVQLLEKHSVASLHARIAELGLQPRMLVLEITEHDRIDDMQRLAEVVARVRSAGIALALDDFGDGRSSLRLWSQLKPETVKIDKYFTSALSVDGDKLKTIAALQQIARIFGTQLIAEGVENAADLRVLRDMGIGFGQGYFLGYPEREPRVQMPRKVLDVLLEAGVAVFPELTRTPATGAMRPLTLIPAPHIGPGASNDELAALFLEHPTLHAVAVLDGEKPVGIVNRAEFMNQYSRLFYREVWGKKSCARHVNLEPRVIERGHSVDDLVGVLTSQDQRYLADGFIVTENGRYVGLGTGEQLVRSVTETRIEAARHANPLTFLPGNIPITQHMERLLAKKSRFAACYADLNNFKPFNDYYGYWRGDEMIRLLASLAQQRCDAERDFLGHVGGDDFILLFQSEDWRARCQALVQDFDLAAKNLYDSDARSAGGIMAEDRQGVMRFFPCTTVSIGAVLIEGGSLSRAEEVANLAAMAKHEAKRQLTGFLEHSAV